MANKQDSNFSGLSIAEETSLKTLPGTPVWYELEPNSYSDFGADIKSVARNPINPSRQRKKGAIVDLDASGGFNTDMVQESIQRLIQGILFADAREKFTTASINGTAAIAITNVDGTGNDYEAAGGLDGALEGSLILASGFSVSGNNGLKVVGTPAAGSLPIVGTLYDETPPATAKIEEVGFQFPTGDVDIDATTDTAIVSMLSSVTDFTTLGLNVGEYVYLGGDSAGLRFASNGPGFARIKAIAANKLDFDDVDFVAADETGTGLTVQMFYGRIIRNEKIIALIKRRSYQLERQIGSDSNGVMSEYLTGAIPNEMKIGVPVADKMTVDFSFVGMDVEQRDGATGIKSGTRVSALGEDPFNTSSDVYRQKLYIVDPTNPKPSALFAYVSESELTVNNNVTPNKAVGVLGAFDASVGDIEVSGSLTAYFAEVAAVQAVRNNADVGYNLICTKQNSGFFFDIPLLGLGGGRLSVEKDQPINIPLDANGAECAAGYTVMCGFFAYLPTVAM